MMYTNVNVAISQLLEQLTGEDFENSKLAIDGLIKAANEKKKEIEVAEDRRKEMERECQRLEAIEREKQRLAEEKAAEQAHIEEVTSMDLPMDWSNFFDTDESTEGVFVESIPDGYIKCLNSFGRVDIEYIASITGEEYKAVIEALKGSIYQNPDKWGECFFKGWETAEEYLSGNIREKLAIAESATEIYNGYFDDNVNALKEVMPNWVYSEQIYITLGSPWVPADIYSKFLLYLNEGVDYDEYISFIYSKDRYARRSKYGLKSYSLEGYKLVHDEITGIWEMPKSYMHPRWDSLDFRKRFGSDSMSPYELFLKTMNMQSVAAYDRIPSDKTNSGYLRVVNNSETTVVFEKQSELIETFQKWVWSFPRRKVKLEELYNERYASTRVRHFDGSFLELPGLNEDIKLYKYQKDAVARIIFSPNTLLAHDVGSGKTYEMIVAGMELKRLGLSKKNLYVVPNNLLGQWYRLFLTLYPEAHIRIVETKDLNNKKKRETLEDVQCTDYDAVIITYSAFEKINISTEYYIKIGQEELEKGNNVLKQCQTVRLRKKLEKRLAQLGELSTFQDDSNEIFFDQLGINTLFVDEAHNFKNVPLDTKIESVMGINKTGSKKCKQMMEKVHIVQSQNNGRGVIFATGTPITNSVTDAYVMQRYLQNAQLELLYLQNFDSWVSMFAEKNTAFEIDVDTSTYRMATRFSKFHNIPELTNMIASFADFHSMAGNNDLPDFKGYTDVVVPKTPMFKNYLMEISERADNVRRGRVPRTEDNLLLITSDGRKAALDMRLVSSKATFTTDSKVFKCADNVCRIYKTGARMRTTQLVFCDTSTPKDGFNIYDELKSLLVRMGIPSEDIAFIHDATTETKRQDIFTKVRTGVIRVLIGSTFKLGLGVNVQDRMVALHHLDVPWRPADMVQREGRILRQGNTNDAVEIYRYITEGSFDAYSWQLLETKQRFITDILGGVIEERDGDDIDDTVLNYAEVKALAVGNPLIKQRIEVSNELTKKKLLQCKYFDELDKYSRIIVSFPEEIKKMDRIRSLTMADEYYYAGFKQNYSDVERQAFREIIQKEVLTENPRKEAKIIMEYQGFDIIAPAKVSKLHPVVYIERAGRYRVEFKDNYVFGLIAIDRYLNQLKQNRVNLEKKLKEQIELLKFAEKEVNNKDPYAEQIESLQLKLERIDAVLGVEKEE